MFFPGGYGFGIPVGRFEQEYAVYPVSFLDKTHLENGDKVIMPPSALDRLASLHIDYPMLFSVQNVAANRNTHCGVLEFVADEGCVYMPYWMMQNLVVQEGDLVRMTNATLPKGTYVKLQPHTKDFLDISNPKAVLETTLRNFSCLTTGDNIMVAYNNKKYYIDIVETRPEAAISIIETDCEVDFAPPLDYVEPPRPAPVEKGKQAASLKEGAAPRILKGGKKASKEEEVQEDPPAPSFQAFTGSGRRLDGKAAQPSAPSAASLPPAQAQATAAGAARGAGGNTLASGSSSAGASLSGSTSSGRGGRLVFGGGSAGKGKEAKDSKTKENPKEPEPPKFQAFAGKGYSLK